MFSIGDRIVYPAHGAGIIESIEEKEILGQKKKYYIMVIPIDDLRIMIPIDSMNEFGIRNIISYNEYEDIMNIFKQNCNSLIDSWSKRYKCSIDKIKRGDIYSIAEVIKDLTMRESKKGISPGEKRILENAEQILFSELMLVTGTSYEDIFKMVREYMFKDNA